MSAISITLAAQRAAERLMVDSCIIRNVTGFATNAEGVDTPTYADPIYSGKCRVQTKIARVQEATAGEHQFTLQRSELHLPVTAGPVKVNAVVEITASAVAPHLVGKVYRVAGTQPKTFESAQRVHIEEVLA
jgi:hypothetical protein